MINPKIFDIKRLINEMLHTSHGNVNQWWSLAEIIPNWMPPHPLKDTQPKCVVKCGDSFLRHSKGPLQGHSWDMYGDDYLNPELALIALSQAPVPPSFIDRKVWNKCCDLKYKVVLTEPKELPLPKEVNVDGMMDTKGIVFIGKATLQDNGKYHCLADVGGALCRVEVSITLEEKKT